METNPPPRFGCGKPLFGKRSGSKVHNDYCRHLAKRRRNDGVTDDKSGDVPTEEWTP
jgi:hypothetical protein